VAAACLWVRLCGAAAGFVSAAGVDTVQRGDYVGHMSENLDDARTGSDAGLGSDPEPGSDTGLGSGRDTGGAAEKTVRDKDDVRSKSPEGDLSTKLDPDVIPQQGDTPEVERTREHPEETGS
jgi:hypothetical protein